jgi:hypothetical protein
MASSDLRQAFGEDTARTVNSWTEEAPYPKPQMDGAALAGKVAPSALVATVNAIGCSPAAGTSCCRAHGPHDEKDRLGFDHHLLKLQGGG